MLKSYLAGIMIGLSAYGYVVIDNKFVSSFLFSFGLLTILISQYKLYTGKIYSLKSTVPDILDKLVILFGNTIGIISVVLIYKINNSPNIYKLNAIVYNKLNQPIIGFLLMGIICGVLIYLAVSQYNKTNYPILVIMPIMLFILIGAEHCIANLFYFACSDYIGAKAAIYLVVNVIANSIGSVAFYHMNTYNKRG